MDKKLSHFQVYGYCRVVVNVLKTYTIHYSARAIHSMYHHYLHGEGHLHGDSGDTSALLHVRYTCVMYYQ
jgi:hypothetical protein